MKNYIFSIGLATLMLMGYDIENAIDIHAEGDLQDSRNKAAADAVAQFDLIKKNSGSVLDYCVQAGLVATAYLKARDNRRYREWKRDEEYYCSLASS